MWSSTYTPVSDPIHMVAWREEGRSLKAFCTSAGVGLRRAVERPTKNEKIAKAHTHTHTHTHTHIHLPPPNYIHLLAIMSGSWSSNSGMAAIHLMGLEHTGNVSSTSPTAAASRILTWEGGGEDASMRVRKEKDKERRKDGRKAGGRKQTCSVKS